MSQSFRTREMTVGGSLIGAGAFVVALGATVQLQSALTLTVVGASFITVGLVTMLAAAGLTPRRSIVIGAVLAAVGTTVSVIGATITPATTALTVVLTGASLLTGGTIQLVRGASAGQDHTPLAGGQSTLNP
ncbi:MAG: hypothetical protein PVG83_12570 [Acidimicrobiia bacterium]|jgi:hypothetical protein